MLKDVTFIISCLNNGYDDNPADPVSNYHRERTVCSVKHLVELYEANVVFVDWCSKPEHQFLPFLPKNTKYVYVPTNIIDLLHQNNESTQKFYEWIAKDIGAHFVSTDWILFTNGDNFFPKTLIEAIDTHLDEKKWYSATRINFENKIFQLPTNEFLQKICFESDTIKPFPRHEQDNPICGFCYGDFTLCTKKAYNLAGGYVYSHKHAYEDHTLTNSLATAGVSHQPLNLNLFHIHHANSGQCAIYSQQPIDKQQIKTTILSMVEVINL